MQLKAFSVTREIGIDAGHRVLTHGSKCRHLHGHRYTIQATCTAEELIPEGEQQGMVLDFGFLKGLMMDHIDKPCDHGFIWYVEDPILTQFLDADEMVQARHWANHRFQPYEYEHSEEGIKFYIVDFIPTAENLAKHWFERLKHHVHEMSDEHAVLSKITVWETPNCKAEYPHG